MKMDKNRFETQKHVVNLDIKKHPIQNYFTVEDLKWLIEQAEKVEELSKFKKDAETLFQRQKLGFANLAEKIERYEKALKFYADKGRYEEWDKDSNLTEYIHDVDFDGGDIAKEALGIEED
jgi:hypothetical protein